MTARRPARPEAGTLKAGAKPRAAPKHGSGPLHRPRTRPPRPPPARTLSLGHRRGPHHDCRPPAVISSPGASCASAEQATAAQPRGRGAIDYAACDTVSHADRIGGQRQERDDRQRQERHACLSTWLNARVDPTQVAEWAGNSVAVLLRVYAKFISGRDQFARPRIRDALPDASEP